MTTVCKQSNCDFVYPVLKSEALGNSLSSINFNFLNVDNELCRLEDNFTNYYDPAFTVFSESSARWIDSINTVVSNSACWESTCSVVAEMSGFWLNPISIIYPYPFPTNTDIALITAWLNDNFPVKSGNCYNFIVGQVLYVNSPEYATTNRVVTNTGGAGKKVVTFTYYCNCIGRGSYAGVAYQNVDCGTVVIKSVIPDTYVNKFVGVKFVVDSNFEWSGGTKIFG